MSTPYALRRVDYPTLGGRRLAALNRLLAFGPTRALLAPRMALEANLAALRAFRGPELGLSAPEWPRSTAPEPAATALLEQAAGWDRPGRVRALGHAFRSGATTPTAALERALAAIRADRDHARPLNAFVVVDESGARAAAEASTARFAAGAPLGPLDGIPWALKDELDLEGFPTRCGSAAWTASPAPRDATLVRRLRAAGAIPIGKTNMHELGINPSGVNVTFGQVRNPFDRRRDAGGSSGGSAAAVAAGWAALALGTDGGGSIRIPAALTGLAGLKASFGRFSEAGVAPLCPSVGFVGPMAATVGDLALVLAAAGGRDPEDPASARAPPIDLDPLNLDPAGLRVGIFPTWFEHADPAAVAAARAGVEALTRRGARVREIELADLEPARVAHVAIILSEMHAFVRQLGLRPSDLSPSTQLSLRVSQLFDASDHAQALRVRAALFRAVERTFDEVDVIATPTTAVAAPTIPRGGDRQAWTSMSATTELMRFVFPANLTGHPALTVPVGEEDGCPLGLQLMGPAFAEARLLACGAVVEDAHPPSRAPGFVELLEGEA